MRCPNPRCAREWPIDTHFCGACGAPLVSSNLERRQISVMFCDLVGYAGLARTIDAEDLHTLMAEFYRTCAGPIQDLSGYVAQYLGDGMLVYFGYPTAGEDDAVRAVRAGLRIVKAIRNIRVPGTDERLQIRVGVHTGEVVIGAREDRVTHDQIAIGEPPNIASRIQGEARPNAVNISAVTHQLVLGWFDCMDLGLRGLKGYATPFRLYEVLTETKAQNRFDVARSVGLTRLVNRENEIDFLFSRWRQAKQERGNAALMRGEAGMGKSRLVQEMRERLGREDAVIWEFRCSRHHEDISLFPIVEHVNRWLEIEQEDANEVKIEKLERALDAYRFRSPESAPLIASFMSWPHPNEPILSGFSPQLKRQRIQETFIALLLERADRQPVLCIWEDLHWADPSTLDLLALALNRISTSRIFFLCVARPHFDPPWRDLSHVYSLKLSGLSDQHSAELTEAVVGRRLLPREIVSHVVARTDGVPLFVEELTKSLLESDAITSFEDRYELVAPLTTLNIPNTLQGSLMARLDRLNKPAKEVAQLSAVVGREFSRELLQQIGRVNTDVLDKAIQDLVDAELIYQRGRPPRTRYVFKHSLIQDTAYHSLLKKNRQELHRDVARIMERLHAGTDEVRPEIIAHHYTEGNLISQAVLWWQRAGQLALERSHNKEAQIHLRKAIGLLDALEETSERKRQALDLYTALGPSLVATKGYASDEVEQVYARADELSEFANDSGQLFAVRRGQWQYQLLKSNYRAALAQADQLALIAECDGDSTLVADAHTCVGLVAMYQGEFTKAAEHLTKAVAPYNFDQHLSHAMRSSVHIGMVVPTYLARTLWFAGEIDKALALCRTALEQARQSSLALSRAQTICMVAILHHMLRDVQATRKVIDELLPFVKEQGLPYWEALAKLLNGWIALEGGEARNALGEISQARSAIDRTGARLGYSWFALVEAQAHQRLGHFSETHALLLDALTHTNKSGERYYLPEIHRMQGETLLAEGGLSAAAQAEARFKLSLSIASDQKAISWELRSAMSLCRLRLSQGRKADAAIVLAPVYARISQGLDCADVVEARRMLVETV